jgi:hypothetical protein
VRFVGDLTGATAFATDAQINDLLDTHLCAVYLLLVQAGPPDLFTSDTTITTVASTTSYALPSDMYSLCQVWVTEADGRLRPIRPARGLERSLYKAPDAGLEVTLEYIPAPAKLAADSSTVDGVAGFEDLLVSLSIRDLRIREGLALESQLETKIAQYRADIRSFGDRSRGVAKQVTDVRLYRNAPWSSGIQSYRVRGANIELLNDIYPRYP